MRLGPAAAGAAALAAFLAFLPTIGFEKVWDDHFVTADAARIAAARGPAGFLSAEYRTEGQPTGYYRPVVQLSLWANGFLPGGDRSLHLANAVLHAGVTALLAAVLLESGAPPLGGFLGALLFGLHPAAVEAVAPVTGRVDLLPALFCLLSAWAWLAHRRRGGGMALLAAGGAAYLAAILSKESGYLLSLALLTWDAAMGPVEGWWARNRGWLAAWGAAVGVSLALRVGAAGVPFGSTIAATPHMADDPLLSFLLLVLFAAKTMALPWPQVTLYTPRLLAVTPLTLAGAALASGVFAAAARALPRRVWVAGLAWSVAFLLPFARVFQLKSVAFADRYVYLSSLAFCGLLGLLLGALAGRGGWWRRGAVALGVAGALSLGSVTLSRLPVWRDEVSLFTEMARVAPEATAAHNNLGVALELRGRLPEAIEAYRRALQANPGNRPAARNLERALRMGGGPP